MAQEPARKSVLVRPEGRGRGQASEPYFPFIAFSLQSLCAQESISWSAGKKNRSKAQMLTEGTPAIEGMGSPTHRSTKTMRSVAFPSTPYSLQRQTRNSLRRCESPTRQHKQSRWSTGRGRKSDAFCERFRADQDFESLAPRIKQGELKT